MKLDSVLNDIHCVYLIEGKILFQYAERISGVLITNSVIINQYNGSFSDNFLYKIGEDRVNIFDLEPEFIKSIFIDCPSSITLLDINHYVIGSIKNDKKYNNFYFDNKLILTAPRFYGKILNQDYRLNYPEGTFNNSRHFRCSDLLDEITYWEYKVIDSEKQIGSFILYEDRLIFYTQEVDKESYDSRFWLNVLDIKSGEQVYHISCKNHSACFDSERGLFVAVQGANQHGETPKTYEIININTGERIFEEFYHDLFFYAVGVTYSVLDNHFLYFTDSPVKHGDTYVFDTPRIGCFDYLAKKLLYFKEIPEMKEKGIKQFVVKGDRSYFRTPENELFIFEDQNETV